jgi:hypothetical protein
MDYVGTDLGKNQSQICIFTDMGELIEKRIHTTRELSLKTLSDL